VFGITKWLLKTFIKDYKNINKPKVRSSVGRFAGWTGIILNLLLVAAKVITGLLSGSLAVVADGLNNLMDASGSIITLAGFKIAEKKADKEHPFGHGRYEYIAGFAAAILVLAVGIELGKNGIKRILKPEPVALGPVIFIILILSILLKLWMAGFYRSLGSRIGSTALKAVSADNRNDTLATGAVLISALISRFAGFNLDGWAGLGVAAFIIYNGISLIKETLSPLLGEAPSSELVEYIAEKILSYEHVLGIHDIIVHDYGPNRRYVSVHVEMPSNEDIMAIHAIIDKIEKSFLEHDGIHLIIHHDPIHPEDEALH
jgi:cation diffusion facilitator family transporter